MNLALQVSCRGRLISLHPSPHHLCLLTCDTCLFPSCPQTLFYSLTEATALICNTDKLAQQQDSRIILARALLASWLNFAKNTPAPVGTMQQAINFLIAFTPDENLVKDGRGDGRISSLDNMAVPSSSSAWSGPCNTATACNGYQGPGGEALKNIVSALILLISY